MTEQTDKDIHISIETSYIEDQSDPLSERYVFSYTITISNAGNTPARLINRHWIITDANGDVQEVRGEGVVGEKPYLKPGEAFRYTSGTVMQTPVGSMRGSYEMISDANETFDVEIPMFTLSIPGVLH